MRKTQVPVTTYGNRKIDARKLAVFAEMDKDGEAFIKIETQDYKANCTAVSFNRNVESAVSEFSKLMRDVMERQIKKLQEEVTEDED